jgi:hypothetical protein
MANNEAQSTDHESTIALMQQGRWDDAKLRLKTAIERNPDGVRARD